MKTVVNLLVAAAGISLVLGLLSRVMFKPFSMGILANCNANSFLRFTDTCLLFAIALVAVKLLDSK